MGFSDVAPKLPPPIAMICFFALAINHPNFPNGKIESTWSLILSDCIFQNAFPRYLAGNGLKFQITNLKFEILNCESNERHLRTKHSEKVIESLLIAQRVDWIEPRRFDRRINSEEKSHAHGNENSEQNGPKRHGGWQFRNKNINQ